MHRLSRAVTIALLSSAIFVALGNWQLQRRIWKLDLIQRVEARIHQPPIDPPARVDWPALATVDWDYRHVSLTGRFVVV